MDVVLISRVLTNLLENAIRHSPKVAPITVRATLRRRDASRSPSPTKGPGSVPSGGTRSSSCSPAGPATPGAGLGLTIAKTFIEAHGQHIWVADAPGRRGEVLFHPAGRRATTRGGEAWRRFSSLTTTPTCSTCAGSDWKPSVTTSARPRPAATGSPTPPSARPTSSSSTSGLPDLDGLEVCQRIRTWSHVPVIVLSADGSEDRKVDALDARRRRLHDQAVRHARAQRPPPGRAAPPRPATTTTARAELDVGALHLDLVHREATLDGHHLDLAPKEFDFLVYLARNVGKVCTRRMILENVWGPGYDKELHYLKVYAYRIRRKLGDDDGQFLQSDPAVGYRLAWRGV